MPNLGAPECCICHHFTHKRGACSVRRVKIEGPHWTTCRKFTVEGKGPTYPVALLLFAFAMWLLGVLGMVDFDRLHLRTSRLRKHLDGPLYAMVDDFERGGDAYHLLPYFDGCRPWTTCAEDWEATVVRFADSDGKVHDFPSVADYLRFYKESGRGL